MSETRQFCTFFLGDLCFGVDVQHVQEVIRWQEMTRVPLAPPMVTGLINLRGQIVTAIDLRERLAMPSPETHREPTNVVVRTADGPVSLHVDEIGDVLEVSEDEFETPPENLSPAVREVTVGVYKLDRRLLLVLDTEKTVQVPATRYDRTGAELAVHP